MAAHKPSPPLSFCVSDRPVLAAGLELHHVGVDTILRVERILAAKADVLKDTVVKERHILEHDGIQPHELFGFDLGNVHSADRDAPLLVIPEARSETGHRGLAAA